MKLHHLETLIALLFLYLFKSILTVKRAIDTTWHVTLYKYSEPAARVQGPKSFEKDEEWLSPNYQLLFDNPTYFPKGYKVKWPLEKDERKLRRCQSRDERKHSDDDDDDEDYDDDDPYEYGNSYGKLDAKVKKPEKGSGLAAWKDCLLEWYSCMFGK